MTVPSGAIVCIRTVDDNPKEVLSAGQAQEITRVHDAYPHLHDDDFVTENLERWLAD